MTLDELKVKVDELVAQGHGKLLVYDDDADTRDYGEDDSGWLMPIERISLYPIESGSVILVRNTGYHHEDIIK